MKLTIVLEATEEGGYTVYVPALPGCVSEGETREEAVRNIREAIELYLGPDDAELAGRKDSEIVKAERRPGSPLDVPGVRTDLSGDEIVDMIRESRKRTR